MSGISFTYKINNEPGSRVVGETVNIDGNPIDLAKTYTVATTDYLLVGKDGFEAFKEAKVLIDEENAPVLNNTIFDFLRSAHSEQFLNEYSIFRDN